MIPSNPGTSQFHLLSQSSLFPSNYKCIVFIVLGPWVRFPSSPSYFLPKNLIFVPTDKPKISQIVFYKRLTLTKLKVHCAFLYICMQIKKSPLRLSTRLPVCSFSSTIEVTSNLEQWFPGKTHSFNFILKYPYHLVIVSLILWFWNAVAWSLSPSFYFFIFQGLFCGSSAKRMMHTSHLVWAPIYYIFLYPNQKCEEPRVLKSSRMLHWFIFK